MKPRDVNRDANRTTGGKSVLQVIPTPSDPTSKQMMRLIEVSGTLDFWDRADEDIYTPNDGEPV